jgi:Na+-transporting NADH:ubiquinone oxidoreductase subunit F
LPEFNCRREWVLFQIVLAVAVFTSIVITLSGVILLARSRLVETGTVQMVVNDDRDFEVPAGVKLLTALSNVGLFLPSGCGGKGTCGQCRLTVLEGGGPLLPTEESLIGRLEAAHHVRLGCQVTVRENVRVRIPDEVFGVRKWECTVHSNRSLSTFIKEINLALPPGEEVPFRAGGYVQVECPRYQAKFSDFDIGPEFRNEWDRQNVWKFQAGTKTPTTRAYSMANYPEEKGVILLTVGIALPPPGSGENVPPGVVSSYLFSLKPGYPVTIAGP